MAAAAVQPTMYYYTYNTIKYQKDIPKNDHTYIGRNETKEKDPNFYWHLAPPDKQRGRLPGWQRAKSRKITKEYEEYIKSQYEPILNSSIQKLGQLGFSLNTTERKYNASGEPSYAYLLRTGKTSKNVKNENAAAKKITPDVLRQVIEAQIGAKDEDTMDILAEALSKKLGIGISGGKLHTNKRKTRKHSKKSRSHRKSSKKTMRKRSNKRSTRRRN